MKFSVIIPVYNVAPYLRECLDSVCVAAKEVEKRGGGGLWTVEAICVDDGSTDGSGDILDVYARRQSNNPIIPNQTIFRVIHQKNAGVGGARNAGLAVATGDWIGFADADDLVAPTAFVDATTLIERHSDVDLVTLGKFDFRNGERPGAASEGMLEERVFERQDCLPQVVEMVGLYQMFVRSDVCAGLQFPGYCLGEDRVFVYRVVRRARKAVFSDKVGYFYRIHGKSISHSRMTLRKRWDDFRYAVHVLAILWVTPQAGWRMRLRYVRAVGAKMLGVMGF